MALLQALVLYVLKIYLPTNWGTLQENLIKSHACSVGEEIRPVIIKLMMLLKAHALSLGHSGVQLITVQRILDFFNNDVLPIVYDRGSLGAFRRSLPH